MLGVVFTIIGAISTAYLVGGRAKYNATIQSALGRADSGFAELVDSIRYRRALDLADWISSMFGWFAMAALVLTLALNFAGNPSGGSSMAFVCTFFVWQGVKWYTDKRGRDLLVQGLRMSAMVILLPLVDSVTGSEITRTLIVPLDEIGIRLFGVQLSAELGTLTIGLTLASFLAATVVAAYLVTSAVFSPVLAAALALALFSGWMAHALDKLAPRQPLFALMVILNAVTYIYFGLR